jgi:hypothetical protein
MKTLLSSLIANKSKGICDKEMKFRSRSEIFGEKVEKSGFLYTHRFAETRTCSVGRRVYPVWTVFSRFFITSGFYSHKI